MSLFKQEKFREALSCYEKALQTAQTKDILVRSLYYKASSWENLREWKKARESFTEFVEKYPEESDFLPLAYFGLANTLFKEREFSQARKFYNKVVETSEDTKLSVEAYFGIGDSYFEEKDFKKALVEYLRIPILYPQYGEKKIEAFLRGGLCYEALGNVEEAKKIYQKILQEKEVSQEQRSEVEKRLKKLKEVAR